MHQKDYMRNIDINTLYESAQRNLPRKQTLKNLSYKRTKRDFTWRTRMESFYMNTLRKLQMETSKATCHMTQSKLLYESTILNAPKVAFCGRHRWKHVMKLAICNQKYLSFETPKVTCKMTLRTGHMTGRGGSVKSVVFYHIHVFWHNCLRWKVHVIWKKIF